MDTFVNFSISTQKPVNSGYPTQFTHIGDYIKKERLDRGLFQREVGALVGVGQEALGYWEQGTNPQAHYLPKIVEFLGYDPFLQEGDTFQYRMYNYMRKEGLSIKTFAKRLEMAPCYLGRLIRGVVRGSDKLIEKIEDTINS